MGQDNAELRARAFDVLRERPGMAEDVQRVILDLLTALERVTPRVASEPTIGTRNPDGSITFNGVFPADATSGVLTVFGRTEPPIALFTPTGKEN